MFCFYGLLKRLLNGIGLHWSQHSVEETSDFGGETRYGNEYLDVHEVAIWCLIPVLNRYLLSLPILTLWHYLCLSSCLLYWNLSILSKTNQNLEALCCFAVHQTKHSFQNTILIYAKIKYFLWFGFFGGLWVVLFWWWVFCSLGVTKFLSSRLLSQPTSSFILKLGGKLNVALNITFLFFNDFFYIISFIR